MARPRVQLISGGVRRLLSDAGVRAEVEARAERVLARAQSLAPSESGALRSSLQVRTSDEDRTVVAVGSPLGYALRINAATGFLTRAVDAAR